MNMINASQLIYFQFSEAIQQGLVNQVYPRMRRVVGGINYDQKQMVILLIYDGVSRPAYKEAMESLEAHVYSYLPEGFKLDVKMLRLDFPKWYNYSKHGWHYFFSFFRHELVDLASVPVEYFDISSLPNIWGVEK